VLGRFRLAPGGNSGSQQVASDAEAAARWLKLAADWKNPHEQRGKANAAFTVLADFHAPKLPDGSGLRRDGMKHGFVEEGTPLVALEGDAVVAALLPRGVHSHALSSKLPGSIFLPPQDDKSGLSLSVRLGGDAFSAIQGLVGNAFLGEEFGGGCRVSLPHEHGAGAWKSFAPMKLKNGVPHFVMKLTTAPLNSYFPGRTGLARGCRTRTSADDKRSWLSITGVVRCDKTGAPQDTLDAFSALYELAPPNSADEAWSRIGNWFAGAVQRWCESQPRDGDVQVVNWLVAKAAAQSRRQGKQAGSTARGIPAHRAGHRFSPHGDEHGRTRVREAELSAQCAGQRGCAGRAGAAGFPANVRRKERRGEQPWQRTSGTGGVLVAARATAHLTRLM